jgi:hypothetical protein
MYLYFPDTPRTWDICQVSNDLSEACKPTRRFLIFLLVRRLHMGHCPWLSSDVQGTYSFKDMLHFYNLHLLAELKPSRLLGIKNVTCSHAVWGCTWLSLDLPCKCLDKNKGKVLPITDHEGPDMEYSYSPSGFGGLEVECWPLVPKIAGSNPAEAVGFFRAKKSSARLPSEGN